MNALNAATVGLVEPVSPLSTLTPTPPSLDAESREWLQGLRANDTTGQEAIARLHALIELVERGCLPELAVRILAPLEEESAA